MPSLVWRIRADFPEEAGLDRDLKDAWELEGNRKGGTLGPLFTRAGKHRESLAPLAVFPHLQDADVLSSYSNLICRFF